MKKLYTLLLAISFATLAHAQLDLDNGIWINHMVKYANPVPVNHSYEKYCTSTSDTTINSLSYRILFDCIDSTYIGALRNDHLKTYFIPVDSVKEIILYDFGLEVGDTLKYYYPTYNAGPNHYAIVESVDSVMIDSEYRKTIRFEIGGLWINGIGCEKGLLRPPLYDLSGFGQDLYCYSKNDTTYHPGYQVGNCPLNISLKELSSVAFEIFPNPTTDFITIQSDNNQLLDVKLYNAAGVLVMSTTSTEVQTKLDLSEIPAATYILSIKGDGFFETKKIIKSL